MEELDDELLGEHVLIAHNMLHEGRDELFLVGKTFEEVQNNGLQEVFDANFTILLDKSDEGLLVVSPCLHDIVLFANVEASAEQDPVAEFGGKALRGSDELELFKNRFDLAWVLEGEGVQLRDGRIYRIG